MKVISVENIIECVESSSGTYLRNINGDWIHSWDYLKDYDIRQEKELEAAYQWYKNPPFKIFTSKANDDSYKMSLNIKGKEFPLKGVFDKTMVVQYKKELEQALINLMENKE